jgi:microcystin-dependent protein
MAVYYIYGTSNSGSTFGRKGFYSPLYLTETEANAASGNTAGTSHPHSFDEVIGVTFYMPTTGAVHPTTSDEGSAPTGQYSGETYISYTSPISDADIEPINFGVLAGDTFNSWRRKTNEVARDAILNKASVASLDSRFSRLIDVTGGEGNIMTLTSSDNITGEKEFEGPVKFTAADDLTNAIQIGSNGKLYASGSNVLFANDIDLHTAGAEIKASNIDLPTGKAKYSGIQYTWPNQAPAPGQILQSGSSNNLSWVTNPAVEAQVEAFVIEDPNPIGSILQWPLTGAPNKWLECDGSLVNRETTGVEGESGYVKGYPELFAQIGDTYGAGDGSTTFQLPNLQGRVPIGLGTTQDSNNLQAQFAVIGSTSGVLRPGTGNAETINGTFERDTTFTIGVDQMPIHTHTYSSASYGPNAKGIGAGYSPATRVGRQNANSGSKGGGQPITITNQTVQPFIVLNYIIKAESSSIVTQNVQPGNGLLINGQRATANLLAANSENSITLDVDTDDFDLDSGQLKLVEKNNTITQTTGTAPYFGVRAWANYDGTTQTLNASGNIESVTRNHTGNYTFNFTTPMPDANYAVSLAYSNETSVHHTVGFITKDLAADKFTVEIYNESNSNNRADKKYVLVSVIR